MNNLTKKNLLYHDNEKNNIGKNLNYHKIN